MIGNWAERISLDAVIWTALLPKFNGERGKIPSSDEVIFYLSNLPDEKRRHAEEYIHMVPRQIDTDYRRKIETVLRWTSLSKI